LKKKNIKTENFFLKRMKGPKKIGKMNVRFLFFYLKTKIKNGIFTKKIKIKRSQKKNYWKKNEENVSFFLIKG